MASKIYLDNAATTPMDAEVLEAMMPYMTESFGNPSSIHSFGRKTRAAIESARKNIAKYLNASPSEIFFTSGGTEADNMAISCAVRDKNIKNIITSRIEHHAVLHTVENLEKEGLAKVHYVSIDNKGNVDLLHLEELLKSNTTALVTLMHANNEIGTLLPISKVGELCAKYGALFHSDTVQTVGHYKIDLQAVKIDMINGAAHKFHGPKGIGFIYIRSGTGIKPFIQGGSQERNMRGGTENLYGIIGMSKAFEVAYRELDEHVNKIQDIKSYMVQMLQNEIPGVEFNGDLSASLYTVLNVRLPKTENGEMLLMNLDINGIAASGGSACTSGSNQGSHVLKALGVDMSRPSVRFSFSKYTTKEEIAYTVEKLKENFPVLK